MAKQTFFSGSDIKKLLCRGVFFKKKKGALEVLETSQEKTRAAVHFTKFELPMDVFLVIFQNF